MVHARVNERAHSFTYHPHVLPTTGTVGRLTPQNCPFSIGVILGGTGVRSGRTDPPLYKYTKSDILLAPHFSDQSYATALSVEGSRPSSNTWFLGVTRVSPQTASLSVAAVFAGLTRMPHRQTCDICRNRPHLCNAA